jgi:carboxypeptidase C (cathepsin A)
MSSISFWAVASRRPGIWNTNNAYADTSQSVVISNAEKPYMKVFIASGYYDMATPYFAAAYSVSAMNLDPNCDRISRSAITRRDT